MLNINEEIKKIVLNIYENPELGFKEFNTNNKILEYVKSKKNDLDIEIFSKTGIKFNLGEKKDIHIVLLAELDALYAPNHFRSNNKTGAAHCCGHYTQVGIMLEVFRNLIINDRYKDFDFSIGFVFVPAEEYVDLEFRKNLIENKEISYIGGKPDAMSKGIFDEYDLCISIHAMGLNDDRNLIEVNCDLAGFMYKHYTFKGKASHAGFNPAGGVNAYSISTLFNNALALYRQQIEENLVRINPVILESNMSINIIPEKIKIGTDLRSHSIDNMQKLALSMDRIAKGVSYALDGSVEIETNIGYFPFKQNRYLSDFVIETFNETDDIDHIINNNPVSAAGDIGDLSYMMPCIQIGYNGFKGTIHGNDFIHSNLEYILGIFPKFLIKVLEKMNNKLDKNKLYKNTYKEYEKELNNFYGREDDKI